MISPARVGVFRCELHLHLAVAHGTSVRSVSIGDAVCGRRFKV